jgi:hypothetical protein
MATAAFHIVTRFCIIVPDVKVPVESVTHGEGVFRSFPERHIHPVVQVRPAVCSRNHLPADAAAHYLNQRVYGVGRVRRVRVPVSAALHGIDVAFKTLHFVEADMRVMGIQLIGIIGWHWRIVMAHGALAELQVYSAVRVEIPGDRQYSRV